MKVFIIIFSLLSGILEGYAFSLGDVGLPAGTAGSVQWFIFYFLRLAAYISISIGGFGCLALKNWARRLLLRGSLVILAVNGVLGIEDSITNHTNYWMIISNISLFCYFVLPICNLYIFTRPKVKEQFKKNNGGAPIPVESSNRSPQAARYKMKAVIYILSFFSGILGGLAFLFCYIGLQAGMAGLAEWLLYILGVSAYISTSVGGFGCLFLENWARRLLLRGSQGILAVNGVLVMQDISRNNINNWNVLSYVILFFLFVLPICNLYIFSRPKVKELFK